MFRRLASLILPKKRASLRLESRKLRDLRAYQFFFQKNALFWVSGHTGRDRVQVAMIGGLSANNDYQLAHLYGNDLRFMAGDEEVEHLVTGYGVFSKC